MADPDESAAEEPEAGVVPEAGQDNRPTEAAPGPDVPGASDVPEGSGEAGAPEAPAVAVRGTTGTAAAAGTTGTSRAASAGTAGDRVGSVGVNVGVWSQVRDAVTLRSALLVIATLGLGLGFIVSYVGGLHHPAPRNLPFDVVAPAEVQAQLVNGLTSLPGQPLAPRLIPDAATARARVADRSSTGALVIDPAASADTLYVASAAGPSVSNALIKIIGSAEATQRRAVTVDDLVPVSGADSGGLSAFYLAVGWTVTGYLIASILGISAGTRPSTPVRAVVRLVALALCAAAAGGAGAWLVQHVLGALPGAFWPLAATGALLVFGAGAITMALEIAFGVVGIGLAVLLFVILGNPAAGGAYARALIPPFWRVIGAFLPPGAGTDAARSIAYFGGARTAQPLYMLGCYAVVGLLVALGLAVLVRPGRPKPERSGSGAG